MTDNPYISEHMNQSPAGYAFLKVFAIASLSSGTIVKHVLFTLAVCLQDTVVHSGLFGSAQGKLLYRESYYGDEFHKNMNISALFE